MIVDVYNAFIDICFFVGIASVYPEPKDKLKHVESQMYNFNYESSLPVTWAWPEPPKIKTRELIPTKLEA